MLWRLSCKDAAITPQKIAALGTVSNEGVIETALRANRSTDVGGKGLGYNVIRNSLSKSSVGTLAIVKLCLMRTGTQVEVSYANHKASRKDARRGS
jgi:hypothetical protein